MINGAEHPFMCLLAICVFYLIQYLVNAFVHFLVGLFVFLLLSLFSFQSQRKAMPKNVQTTAQLYSSHMLAK